MEVIILKITWKNCKKIMASLFLVATMVMIVSPTVKGNEDSITKIGRRDELNNQYRSHTQVKAYDGRGYAYNLRVVAEYGTQKKVASGSGNVTANTAYVSEKCDAGHAYQIGDRPQVFWWKN